MARLNPAQIQNIREDGAAALFGILTFSKRKADITPLDRWYIPDVPSKI